MAGATVQVRDQSTGRVVASRVTEARSPFRRLRGLLGRDGLEAGEGLLITPCNGVHTFGMRFPIDVAFLDRSHRVLRVVDVLVPGRVVPWVAHAHHALELPAGSLREAGVAEGSALSIDPLPEVPS